MQNLQDELAELLKNEENLVIEGQLNKNKIAELALKVDSQLIKLLIKSPTFKKHFFTEVEGVLIFDKIEFQRFVNNKSFLPDSYTAFKNKIGLTINDNTTDNYLHTRNDVVLVWPHKDCYLEGGQTKEDQKRNEIFWNETLAPDEIDRLLDPKVFTNWKKIDATGENPVTDITGDENLMVKGNNLLVLASLKKRYSESVKLIYIDPPFNTENDSFLYNDSFNHSTWLTFMKNRLEVSKSLLKNDGILVVHLDHIEQAYLQILLDEIYGRDNFVNCIAVKSSTPSGPKTVHKDKTVLKQKDFLLIYRKSSNAKFKPQYKRKDKWDTHFNFFLNRKSETVESLINVLIENNILKKGQKLSDFDINNATHRKFYLENKELICQTQSHKNEALKQESRVLSDKVLFVKKDLENESMFYNGRQLTPLKHSVNKVVYNNKLVDDVGMLVCDFWDDIDFQNTQNEGGVSFTNGKKPEQLLYRIIELTTDENDIILDFFAGSGTTASVALKMNRRFITIEQMDYIHDLPSNRLKNTIDNEQGGISELVNWKGGGSYIFNELKSINEEYIDRLQAANDKKTLNSIWLEMQDVAILSYQFDKKTFNELLAAFNTASLDEMKKYLFELLDKNQLCLNYSEIDDDQYKISTNDKILNKKFYSAKTA